jgi:dethiobiotin synthetase
MDTLMVTGTGSGVGKTVVTAAIAALAPGSVAVCKPAQTGVFDAGHGDVAEVGRLSGCTGLYEFARYPNRLSPEAAARHSGLPDLEMRHVLAELHRLEENYDLVLVEGTGGLLTHFAADGWTLADLALELGAPLVLVVGTGLDVPNQTALTLRVVEQHGVALAGAVVGRWPAQPGLIERSNVIGLEHLAPSGLLGALPAGVPEMADFRRQVRPWLAPELGGTFDSRAFLRSVRRGF